MTRTIGTTETHVAEAFAAMIESLDNEPAPYWGHVFVRDIALRQHPAWHLDGLTLERTCADGPTEQYRLVSESYDAFVDRLGQTPIGQPRVEDVKFTITVKLRYPLMTTRTVWSLCITHYGDDHNGRTRWQRLFDGSVKCDHSLADHDRPGAFRPSLPGFEQIRVVGGMERDLSKVKLGLFLGDRVDASA